MFHWSQMMKQNYDACAGGAKTVTIIRLRRHQSGKVWAKYWLGEGHKPPENPRMRLDMGRAVAQAWENPGKRLDSLIESLLFCKPKEIHGSLARNSEQPLPYSLPALSASLRVYYPLSLVAPINLATVSQLLLCQRPWNSFPVTPRKNCRLQNNDRHSSS